MEQGNPVPRHPLHHLRRLSLALAGVLGLSLLAAGAYAGCSGSSAAAPSGSGVASAPPPRLQAAADGPSDAARMTCAPQTRAAIAAALALPEPPEPTDGFADQAYTCTYDLAAGPLVLTVTEFPDAAAALHEFDTLQRASGQGRPIPGLASLGLPAYQPVEGTVIFAKDNMILEVDATAMERDLGPNRVSPGDFAYQIATNVLACWTAHH